MRGLKRAAVSEGFPESTDSPFKNAKPVEGTLFGTQSSLTSAPLDKQRAELARKHVRALNNQFVSWVQLQLKNHPDELWEDGMNDYIRHASYIMDKFEDVVIWLKDNKEKGVNNVSPQSREAEKKSVAEVKNSDVKPVSSNNLFASNTQPALFSTNQSSIFSSSQSSALFPSQPGLFSSSPFGLASNSQTESFSSGQFGVTNSSQSSLFSSSQAGENSNSQSPFSFSNNQTPFSSGVTPVSIPAKRDSPDDADGEDEQAQPSSPSLKKTEEKGVTVVHEVKCKLYIKSTNPADKGWKDKGTGNLCIKCKEGVEKGTKESKPTILVRNDVGKLLLNALLYAGIKTSTLKNAVVAIFHSSEESNENVTPRTFLIRLKTAEARDQLASAIQEYAPSS